MRSDGETPQPSHTEPQPSHTEGTLRFARDPQRASAVGRGIRRVLLGISLNRWASGLADNEAPGS